MPEPYAYATSHSLVEVDGRLRKDLREPAPSKPGFLHDPGREGLVYERILASASLGTPLLHSARAGVLEIERVEGTELWQIGEPETWARVARWLAGAHARLAPHADEPFLIRYDRAWYELWLERAALPELADAYARATERLLALPRTVVHGELYPSNVLVAGERICVVDWETAGAGPGVVDLAALVTGWGEDETSAIVAAYGAVDPLDLAAARLHLAVRWLGWSRDWTPPQEHARDWRAEALAAAEAFA